MSVNIAEFWKLAAESRLLSPEQCQRLEGEFGGVKGAALQGNARTLSEWLIARDAISRYQATLLLAGRPGPFEYGEYRIDERIDRGRLAGLFRAVHGPTGHRVLLHYLSGPVLASPELWRQTAIRGDAHVKLVHPHLWQCYELADLVTYKFLVLEELPGDLLGDMILQRGPLPAAEAARMARQAALALAAMHGAQLVHGDVSPFNIWMDPSGNVKLLRDPLAAPAPLNLTHDPTGRTSLRADYAAPELMQPGRVPDTATDIYALGCTLYFLLAGRPPFPGGDATSKLQRHLTQPPEPIERFPGVPPQLASLVNLMLAKQPSQRVQHANVVAQGLAPLVDPRMLAGVPVPLPSTHAAFERAVQQKTAALHAQAMAAAGASAAASGAVAGGIKAAPAIETGAAKAVTPSAPVVIADPTAADPAKPASERLKAGDKGGTDRNMLIALGVIGAAALVALIVFLSLPPAKEPDPIAKPGTNPPVTPVDPKPGTPVSSDPGTKKPIGPVVAPIDPFANPVKPPVGPVSPPIGPVKPPVGPVTPPVPSGPSFVTVDDDGSLPWASPTWGPPVPLNYIPHGAQIVMIARPADLLASPEGAKVLKGLGPEFEAARANWEKNAGIALADVEQLLISLHDVPDKLPRPAFVIRTKEPQDWPARWAGSAEGSEGGEKVFRQAGWAKWAPAKGENRVAVMAGDEEMKGAIELKGAPPPSLTKEFNRLARLTDQSRHFTAIFSPSYLITDGRELFYGSRQKLKDPLDKFLAVGDGTQMAGFSAHFAGQTYLELRVISTIDTKPTDLANQFRDRLKEIPDAVERYIVDLNPSPYWKLVAFRYPQMIRMLHQHTRVGAEDDMALLNAVLPGPAGHNLVAASELVIAAAPGAGSTAAVAPPMPGNETLADKLAKKNEMSFPAQTLEFAMRDLGEATGISIKILGPDLQAEGITRNQTIRDFNEKDKPVSDILTALCRRANPVTTVKDASEKDQKLVWLIGPDPEGGKETVLITTRVAAEKKKLTLPAVFVPKGAEKK